MYFSLDDYATVYHAGYSECTKEMYQNIMTMDGLEHSTKCRILSDLGSSKRAEEKRFSPPPSPSLSINSLSPAPSPTGSPVKTRISTIFVPTTRQVIETNRIIVPMVTPTNGVTMSNERYSNISNKYHHQVHELKTLKSVIRPTSVHVSKDYSYTSNEKVWRPW